jgi:hypothetical protein
VTSLPLPTGLAVDAANWTQTPLVVRQLIVQLLAVIQQQTAQIAALEARLSQNSRNSDRPPSSDPPFATRPSASPMKGTPGAKLGHPGHRQVLLAPAPPTSGEVQTWYARMVHLIDQYRRRQDEAGTFPRTLDREMRALWTFVVEEGVEPTNNRAERALRFAVLWRKISQGSYNAKGDRWVERILSLRETCRLRGIPTFPVLVEAVRCSFNDQPPEVSWIYRI